MFIGVRQRFFRCDEKDAGVRLSAATIASAKSLNERRPRSDLREQGCGGNIHSRLNDLCADDEAALPLRVRNFLQLLRTILWAELRVKEDRAFILWRVLSVLVDFSVEAPRLSHRIDDDKREAIALFDRIENLGGKCFGIFAGLNASGYGLLGQTNLLDGRRIDVEVFQFDRFR